MKKVSSIPCSIPGCGKPKDARGYCPGHYARWRRYGDPLGGGAARGKCSLDGAPESVNKGHRCKAEGCKEWARARSYCGKHYYRCFYKVYCDARRAAQKAAKEAAKQNGGS